MTASVAVAMRAELHSRLWTYARSRRVSCTAVVDVAVDRMLGQQLTALQLRRRHDALIGRPRSERRNVQLARDLHKRALRWAEDRDVTLVDVVDCAVLEYLDSHDEHRRRLAAPPTSAAAAPLVAAGGGL
jgi:hypothetical protein